MLIFSLGVLCFHLGRVPCMPRVLPPSLSLCFHLGRVPNPNPNPNPNPKVLFNAAFNTSFEHPTPLEEECGYQFRDQRTRMLCVLVTGYADDIGLLTGTCCGRDSFRNNELVLKRLQA